MEQEVRLDLSSDRHAEPFPQPSTERNQPVERLWPGVGVNKHASERVGPGSALAGVPGLVDVRKIHRPRVIADATAERPAPDFILETGSSGHAARLRTCGSPVAQ